MLPDRVSNPGPLTYESGALPIALRGPAISMVHVDKNICKSINFSRVAFCFLIVSLKYPLK